MALMTGEQFREIQNDGGPEVQELRHGAFVSRERWEPIDPEDNVHDAPELANRRGHRRSGLALHG